ncbi:hypothetical protein GS982_01510 [Rhodococcus hoagii]|uniref:Uncharacterized protein n=1 Tax=Rhodococcus hoagii TaxID=43767 RepID=A0A9Q4ZIJ6_RHOHA|nr:hypothetical protein [Prescottella equi]NKT77274.1 hypothetical protein [Prescottella equi]NKT77998.1 hypothetical protein [Prescottella equi]NKZ81061.1 hypothetical protein [Prescottella equi]
MKKRELIEALAGLGDDDEVQLHVATIDGEGFVNVYVNLTEAGLNAEVADFCRTYWEEVTGNEDDEPPTSDVEAIDTYFDAIEYEELERATCTIGN